MLMYVAPLTVDVGPLSGSRIAVMKTMPPGRWLEEDLVDRRPRRCRFVAQVVEAYLEGSKEGGQLTTCAVW